MTSVAGLRCADLLATIAEQADEADRTRGVAPAAIAAVKASPLMAMAASHELGGPGAGIAEIAVELAAIAAACGSTAWCLWNHLSVFHLYAGALGPAHTDLLTSIVERHEWVCFPAGAGSRAYGHLDDATAEVVIDGPTTFGSGSRYAEWTAVAFAMVDPATGRPGTPPDLRFTIARIDDPAVRVEATWDGMALRASSTDTVHHDGTRVPLARCVPWHAANRADTLRDREHPVVHARYREDWVGLSDLWLAALATGTARAALEDAAAGVAGRRAIMGAAMADMPMVAMRLGEASSMVAAAEATVHVGCAEVDARIAADEPPSDADHVRQLSLAAQALRLCREAMDQLLAVLGGNGLREGGSFQRRYRDVLAMPLHINAHPDRVHDRAGRLLLDAPPIRRF